MEERKIRVKINGRDCELSVKPNELLLNVLRNKLGLCGTKYGCGTGDCGACTVLVNNEPKLSCLTLAVTVDGAEITTIEGLATDGKLHPIQDAFVKNGAIQCGFCIPGIIIMAKALLDENPHPTDEEIKEALKGHLCRCTGYINIIKAIKAASMAMSKA
ncbi:MAG: (2Fe-2S)-binding protein [Hadesarchaea archaeon]|nr:(2Fe-2S)-binding protein [Hadesarchaea archaeon]